MGISRCECDSSRSMAPNILDLIIGLFHRPRLVAVEMDLETGELFEFKQN